MKAASGATPVGGAAPGARATDLGRTAMRGRALRWVMLAGLALAAVPALSAAEAAPAARAGADATPAIRLAAAPRAPGDAAEGAERGAPTRLAGLLRAPLPPIRPGGDAVAGGPADPGASVPLPKRRPAAAAPAAGAAPEPSSAPDGPDTALPPPRPEAEDADAPGRPAGEAQRAPPGGTGADPAATPVETAARVAAPKPVARSADDVGLPLARVALIGIIHLQDGRRALLRLPDGSFRRVGRGDALDGWKVRLIGRDAVRLEQAGETRTLLLVGR